MKQYEISIWEDVLIEDTYQEQLIAPIGGKSITSGAAAINPQLVRNINGTCTLTFKMYYTFVNTQTGEKEENPFIKLLINERKIKLHKLDTDEWLDFYIKNISENTGDKSMTYTCRDLPSMELGKTGFNLELDTELQNNMGTVNELAATVLVGSDWKLLTEGTEKLFQLTEESLYKVSGDEIKSDITIDGVTIPKKSQCLVFYSSFLKGATRLQLLYRKDKNYQTEYGKMLVTNARCLTLDGINTFFSTEGEGGVENIEIRDGGRTLIEIRKNKPLSNKYRGDRKVYTQKTKYNKILGRHLGVYTKKNDEEKIILGYKKTNFTPPMAVINMVVNSEDFVSTESWVAPESGSLVQEIYPPYNNETNLVEYDAKSYLAITTDKDPYYNMGMRQMANYFPNGIVAGDKFIFRYKLLTGMVMSYESPTEIPEDELLELQENFYKIKEGDENIYIPVEKVCKSNFSDYWIKPHEGVETYEYATSYNSETPYYIKKGTGDFEIAVVTEDNFSNFWTRSGDGYIKANVLTSDLVYYTEHIGEYYQPVEGVTASTYTNYYIDIAGLFRKATGKDEYNIDTTYYDKLSNAEDIIYLECVSAANYLDGIETDSKFKVKKYNPGTYTNAIIPVLPEHFFNGDPELIERADSGDWVEYEVTCENSISASELALGRATYISNGDEKEVDIRVEFRVGTGAEGGNTFFHLEALEFFPYMTGSPVSVAYDELTDYKENDVVDLEGSVQKYVCIRDVTGVKPTKGILFWKLIDEEITDPYTDTVPYSVGEKVEYDGHSYICISPITGTGANSVIPSYSTYYWKAVGSTLRINPGSLTADSIERVVNVYYSEEALNNATDAKELPVLYENEKEWQEVIPVDTNEKIRSISIKQSNRFNILQTLAETFGCWVRFEIEHDNKGAIKSKSVKFIKDVGEETGLGFIYGIDLQSIVRNVVSDQIVTKTIVGQNSNQYAENGFSSIARSTENYSRENFILNFDYYSSHGLLDGAEFSRDLYLPPDEGDKTSIGYYFLLNGYNTTYDENTKFLKPKKLQLEDYLSLELTYSELILAIEQEVSLLRGDVISLVGQPGLDYETARLYVYKENLTEGISKVIAVDNNSKTLEDYQSYLIKLKILINNLKEEIQAKEEEQKEILKNKAALEEVFVSKYGKFIQEGSWISEDYVDDNKYYLDAQEVAFTSSKPQISYTINVAKLDSLEGFKLKKFNLGDIAFVQDVEFFGYDVTKPNKTPYKEKIIITEIRDNLDLPEQGVYVVSNYKTQFEDLFQRITATTQSLQYASGEYNKSTKIFAGEDFSINPKLLQNSIDASKTLVESSSNQTIVKDSTGITVSDLTEPNNKTKITSGGIFITTDGGLSWKNAVRGGGIATQYLTAGAINADKIMMYQGAFPSFRWDQSGINAYYSNNGFTSISKGVRFSGHGLYGFEGVGMEQFLPRTEKEVWDSPYTKFALTWGGFLLRNNSGNGDVTISTTDDFVVREWVEPTGQTVLEPTLVERIKIGRIGGIGTKEDPYKYGIIIKDRKGLPVMSTGDDGELFLSMKIEVGSIEKTTIGFTEKRGLLVSENFVTTDIYYYYNSTLNEYIEVTIKTQEEYDNLMLEKEKLYIVKMEVLNSNNKVIIYENGFTYFGVGEFKKIKLSNSDIELSLRVFEDSSVRATEDGLTIRDGNFRIFSQNEEAVYFNEESLYIDKAIIGGFVLKDNRLISANDTGLLLNGQTGEMYADKITIGTSAKIQEYIMLGDNVKLSTPTTGNNGTVLEAPSLIINELGVIQVGDISIDGPASKIYGEKFSITPELATFSNVLVEGRLGTNVYQAGKTQVAGGVMLFHGGFKIKETELIGNKIKISIEPDEGVPDLSQLDQQWVYLLSSQNNENNLKLQQIFYSEEDGLYVIDNSEIPFLDYSALSVIGTDGDMLMGINSTGSKIGSLSKNSLSIHLLENNEGSMDFKEVLRLGQLQGDQKTYGLSSESVRLVGSLTTKYNDAEGVGYAGINTLNTAVFRKGKEGIKDNSNIIFWAGSKGVTNSSIEESKFQVTSNGTIYAQQGIFEGSIFLEGIIKAPTIEVAKIYGNSDEEAALSIYNTTKGISFKQITGLNQEIDTLVINSDGMFNKEKQFLFFDERVTFDGDILVSHIRVPADSKETTSVEKGVHLSEDSIRIIAPVSELNSELIRYSNNFYYEIGVNNGYDLYILEDMEENK